MITDLFKQKKTLSFEVFPPKKDGEFEAAFEVLDALGSLQPDFISVTYGAGGSRSKKTVEIASYIQNTLHIDALAHMTCVGSRKEDLLSVCEELARNNISHVLALRGDRPKDMTDEQFESRDFAHANDMMVFLKEHSNLHLAGACYPEKHFECFSMESDLQNLKRKQEAGAEFLITQLFFDNDAFYAFREKAAAKGITLPICAGIMPITTPKQIGTTISLSGSSIPKALSDIVAAYGDNPQDMRKAGIDYAIRQIRDLQQNQADGIHIYTMNKPETAAEIVKALQ
ncbi:MAG TPA: methylenetetrahydrofolate reductase [NAD(P)H] [Candidatus Acetatifactor stercoripullorum]|uniref:Methylenetetrahydrofolate reductase n=1 Tax=Candidatus Acetatifactor stercoripullorum TaxID=2838414 RepID=A0A9D1UB20_9FIRM|nr:methylenetetrahydrofolate reductase [NAD(P)H] [uncultured Acetatifactor sp.]HIW80086.1 methylenetetrahydrofolate reductase [NAD(P)H] [Candidatus Acetatifactor stercoripullorum]